MAISNERKGHGLAGCTLGHFYSLDPEHWQPEHKRRSRAGRHRRPDCAILTPRQANPSSRACWPALARSCPSLVPSQYKSQIPSPAHCSGSLAPSCRDPEWKAGGKGPGHVPGAELEHPRPRTPRLLPNSSPYSCCGSNDFGTRPGAADGSRKCRAGSASLQGGCIPTLNKEDSGLFSFLTGSVWSN